jgi:hypothetical protein
MADWVAWGFRRKDHWQKHMKAEHHANRDEVKELQESGIAMAVLKEGIWTPALPKSSQAVIPAPSFMPQTGESGVDL